MSVRECTRICVCVRARTCVCVHAHMCVHACIPACTCTPDLVCSLIIFVQRILKRTLLFFFVSTSVLACTHTHTHTHTGVGVRKAGLCSTMELVGGCLKCTLQTPTHQLVCFNWRKACLLLWCNRTHARWACVPEVQVRIPSRGRWAFFPSCRQPYLSSFSDTHTHTHTHTHTNLHAHTRTHARTHAYTHLGVCRNTSICIIGQERSCKKKLLVHVCARWLPGGFIFVQIFHFLMTVFSFYKQKISSWITAMSL